MKRNVSLLLCLCAAFILKAQIQIPADAKKQPGNAAKIKTANLPVINNGIGTIVNDIEVFELPDYQGRSGYFKLVNGKLVHPFPGSKNISFKVPRDKIVYIRTFFEFPSESVFTKSQTNTNLQNVTAIRSDDESGVYVEFNGISTAIHNNDCKKVYGNIKVKIIEVSPDGDEVQSYMPLGPIPGLPGRQVIRNTATFTPFSFANAGSITESYYNNHIYNNDPEPNIQYPRGRHEGIKAPATGYFVAGKNALREGRVKIWVSSDLASAHKTCNTCDDFSSRIKMKTPVNELVPVNIFIPGTTTVNTTGKLMMFGPYRAFGSRDGTAITATAGTVKDFRVYFKLKFYE